MAATLTRERFQTPEWVFERKLDGIRVLAFKDGRDVRLLSRNQLPQNHHYPLLVEAIAALPVENAVLDGEALDGRWDHQLSPGYYLFDLLWLDGRDLTALPLDERREHLCRIPLEQPLVLVERVEEPEPWKRACAEGWEGVIAKRRDSVYEHRRSPNWLKMKCEASQELVIGGFTDPQGKRVGFGALLVGYYEDDDFVFAGKIGTGFDTQLLLELRRRLDALAVAAPPFSKATGLPRAKAHWVKPEVVVQVGFMEWTSGGKLRHPRLMGLREDKAARDVTREAR
jgi:bifunctional non-homologous end joining protein LigD